MKKENIITEKNFDFAISFYLTYYITGNQHIYNFRHCEFYFF